MGGEPERVEQRVEPGVAARGAASRTFCSTVRHGNSRGSWNTMPSVPCAGSATLPSKSRSSPARIRSSVVLPQPDGPTSAATSPPPG